MVEPPSEGVAARAQGIFLKAVETLPQNEWDAYLTDACGDDSELRNRVEEMLAVHAMVDDHLGKPTTVLSALANDEPVRRLIGAVIGPYQLRESIGCGGMGIVYAAQQTEPVQRQVALKIVKPGMDTKQVIARFNMERRALALMDHPNIAHVYDAGETDSGLPYFVMELVRGMPITDYCDFAHLSVRQRLKLFVKVCQAVQHAHQKGIIHRDIKPSNVMVAVHDGVAVPKIIDFGVAKAIDQDASDGNTQTLYAQMIGTPLYMSPEQAELGGVDVDTRTDIYSLGVLLYEMLVGSTPFDRKSLYHAGYDEMRRMIREDEPPRPSDRISTLDEATLSTVIERRRTDTRKLKQTLRGDLDWIISRALEKDRRRRYETASEFAADIRRFLDDEPVAARPPSTAYRLRKLARRHRGILAWAGVIACLLIVGITVSTWQAVQLKQALGIAEIRTKEAEDARYHTDAANRQLAFAQYVSDMQFASDALRNDDIPQVKQLLDRHAPANGKPDFRGFEWYYLHQLIDVHPLREIHCNDEVFCVNTSPDGKLLACACDDGNIYVYDLQTTELLRTLVTGAESANFVSWSPDQTELATADASGNLKFWRTTDGELLLTISAHDSEANGVVYSSDGRWIYSNDNDHMIYRWNRATGEQDGTYSGHGRDAEQIALSRDGRHLASVSSDKTFCWWDVDTKTPVFKLDLGDSRLLCLSLSDDGQKIAVGSVRGGVHLIDVPSRTHRKIAHQVDGIESIRFLENSRWLATGDRGGTIHYWPVYNLTDSADASAGDLPPAWSAHVPNSDVATLAKTPDGQWLLSGGTDKRVKYWKPNFETAQWTLPQAGPDLIDFAVAENGQLFLADMAIHAWDLKTRTGRILMPHEEQHKEKQKKWVSVAASRDGGLLAAAHDERLVLRDLHLQETVASWPVPRDWADPHLAVSPVGRRIAVGWYNSSDMVEVYDADQPRQIKQFPGRQCDCVNFSHDGRRLVYGAMDDAIIVDLENDEQVAQLVGHSSTLADCAFSPDDKHVATVSHDRRLALWNARTGERVYSIVAHRNRIRTVDFSPDGNTIVTGGEDRVVKLWDRASGHLKLEFGEQNAHIRQARFTPDGQRIVCRLKNGTIVVYDISTPTGGDS